MDSLMKSDVFFFITGISVILLTIFWLVLLIIVSFFGFKILKNIKIVSDIFKDQTEKISQDFEKTKEDINDVKKEAKTSILLLLRFFNTILEKIPKKQKSKKNNEQ